MLDERLGEVAKRRAGIEEQLAGRETERTEAWGRLTAVRAAHERLTVRAEALGARRAELVRGLDRRRAMLGALAEELGAGSGARAATTRPAPGSSAIGEALADAVAALDAARAAGDDRGRATELAKVREAAERAAQMARRLEDMLGGGARARWRAGSSARRR